MIAVIVLLTLICEMIFTSKASLGTLESNLWQWNCDNISQLQMQVTN